MAMRPGSLPGRCAPISPVIGRVPQAVWLTDVMEVSKAREPEPVHGDLDASWWRVTLDAQGHSLEQLPPPILDVQVPVLRMGALLEAWALGFCTQRPDVLSPKLALGSRGLHPDECASFLSALDGRHLHADSAGYIVPLSARKKAVGGRYALCCKAGGAVTVNTEYIVQLGAVGELVTTWRWDAQDLQVEMSEFDIAAFGPDGRVILAVEVKARVKGADGLELLLRKLLRLGQGPPPMVSGNAERKYLLLLHFCQKGPVVLWLIAAGARWSFLAVADGDRLVLTPAVDVDRDRVIALSRAG